MQLAIHTKLWMYTYLIDVDANCHLL